VRENSIIIEGLKRDLAGLTDAEFHIYLLGLKHAGTAAVFSSGVMGSDVIRGVQNFPETAKRLRQEALANP
jgi:hypothetical protein